MRHASLQVDARRMPDDRIWPVLDLLNHSAQAAPCASTPLQFYLPWPIFWSALATLGVRQRLS
jgi:hypothetical protein